jgi:Protein of unknown function (DUF3768)
MTTRQMRIQALNDDLRRHHRGGRIVITAGVQALGTDLVRCIDNAIASFSEFTPDNDPYGEHDFGAVEVSGKLIFFKIDYYDLDLRHLSPDPADPTLTCRVMTVMLADEY